MAARRENKNEVARIYLAHATVGVAEFGNSAHAVESSDAALSLSLSRDVKLLTALTLAGAGSANRTRSLEDELSKSNPGNTILNDWLPIIRRAAELDARHACSSAVGNAFGAPGGKVKELAAYQDFLTLWKDADPDISILIAAKSGYAKLH